MSDNAAFLKAILDNPDDDQLRLIYADWLEERGDPRGEFIRVQYARPEADPNTREYLDLVLRERQLLALHEAEWLGQLSELGTRWEFRHGFAEKGEMTARQFLERAERLFQLAPVRAMRFTDVIELTTNEVGQRVYRSHEAPVHWMPSLAQCAWLSRLSAIALCQDAYLTDEDVSNLGKSPYVLSLQKLELSTNGLGLNSARALAAAPSLTALSWLSFSGNAIGDLGIQALAASTALPSLRHLIVQHCDITATGLRTLAGSDLMNQLETLELDGNVLENAGARLLASSPRAANLTALSLRATGMNTHGVEALAASPHLHKLKRLDLRQNNVTDRAAYVLSNRCLDGLSELALGSTHIGPNGQARLRKRFGHQVHF
jgi:uncharacterized protein (TIGR02996 family)